MVVVIYYYIGYKYKATTWYLNGFPNGKVPLCDHVPDWQPRILLSMVEARSVNVKNTTQQ